MNPKILFINPCVRPDTPKKIINVGLAYVVSAVQRAGYEFQILDIDAHRYSNDHMTEYFHKKINFPKHSGSRIVAKNIL